MNFVLCIHMSYLFWKEQLPEASKRIQTELVPGLSSEVAKDLGQLVPVFGL